MKRNQSQRRRPYLLLLALVFLEGLDAFSIRRKSIISKADGCPLIVDFASLRSSLSASEEDDETADTIQKSPRATAATSKANDVDAAGAIALQRQAAALRAEADLIEKNLRASQEAKRQKELADIDRWIEQCLYVVVPSSHGNDDEEIEDGPAAAATGVELLNSVETAAQILRDKRYSHEQVSKMFERICDTSPAQSRSNCSPLLALLVDAAGKLDCVERVDNPNKRWDGRVERDLRKRLFAMDWGFHLEADVSGSERFL